MSIEILIGAFVTSIVSGFVPLVNGEAVVLAAALVGSAGSRVPLVLACASGQMIAKLVLYTLARWSPSRLPRRPRELLVSVETLAIWTRAKVPVLFISALVGVPPFYLITLAAGLLKFQLAMFLALGTAGVLLRYSILIWAASQFGSGPVTH